MNQEFEVLLDLRRVSIYTDFESNQDPKAFQDLKAILAARDVAPTASLQETPSPLPHPPLPLLLNFYFRTFPNLNETKKWKDWSDQRALPTNFIPPFRTFIFPSFSILSKFCYSSLLPNYRQYNQTSITFLSHLNEKGNDSVKSRTSILFFMYHREDPCYSFYIELVR